VKKSIFGLCLFVVSHFTSLSWALAPVMQIESGLWQQDCRLVNDDWIRAKLVFTEESVQSGVTNLKSNRRPLSQQGRLEWVRVGFEEENCQKPYLEYSLLFAYLFDNQNKIDLLVKEAAYTPLTDEVAEALNLVSYCGSRNWKKNHRQVVSGQDCDGFHPPQKEAKLFWILQLSESGSGQMRERGGGQSQILWGEPRLGSEGESELSRVRNFDDLPYILK